MGQRLSQSDFARHIGRSRQYVHKLVRAGKVDVGPDGLIDAVAAVERLKAMADPARQLAQENAGATNPEGRVPVSHGSLPLSGAAGHGPVHDDPVEDDDVVESAAVRERKVGDYSRAATVQKTFQAKMAQMEYERAAGNLVSKADVEKEAFDCARATRERLMSIPQEVCGPLVMMKDEREIAVFLRNKIRDALMEVVGDVGIGD